MMNMAVHRLTKVIQNLRRTTFPDVASVSDRQLLDQFIEHQDEYAFAALVQRHSPTVWGVCRRIVAHHQDAEDAFQATFLVLARKATSIRPREMVANWLFGVAHRTALKAKTMAAKRYAREKQVTTMPEPEAAEQGSCGNLESLIDQELVNLPDKYRIAILLCDLEGKKGKDVAHQLKIPEGTLASRLRTGRVMLAKRLARQGVVISGGALATVLSQNAASANAPTLLVSSTIKAATLTAAGKTVAAGIISANAAVFMEGVMKAMFLTKLKTVMTVLLVLGMAGFGGGLLSRHTAAGQQATAESTPPKKDQVKQATGAGDNAGEEEKKKKEAKQEDKEIQGDWKLAWIESEGKKTTAASGMCAVFDKTMEISVNEKRVHFEINPETQPKSIRTNKSEGIYKLQDGVLVVCFYKDGRANQKPPEFTTKVGSGLFMMGFKREESKNPLKSLHDSLVPKKAAKEIPQNTVPSKETLQTDKGKAQRVTYPVADLVVPIRGLDVRSAKNEEDKTKQDWLIKKITRTVSPASWEDSGGAGTIHYFPNGKALVVNNTPRVQSQVKYVLETMRRVQDVQVAAETRIISLNAASFVKLQGLLPQLKKDGHAVMSDAETFALLRQARDDADTKVVQAPKVTFFPGQHVSFSMDLSKDLPGIKKTDVKLSALVAANLRHIELDVKATVGKAEFTKATRLEDGVTLAQFKRYSDGYLIFLVTPRVILSLEEGIAAPEAESHQVAPPAADKAPNRQETGKRIKGFSINP
jgi:RNA polymerase sigma factor (sigma-70 family)